MTTETETQTTAQMQAAALAYLASKSVTYSVRLLGERQRKDSTDKDAKPWQCDAWMVTLSRGSASEDFEYFTGTGHRKPPPAHLRPRPAYKPGTIAHAEYLKTFKPVPPHAADVLHCFAMDGQALHTSFHDWCGDFGYDQDSRRALATYEACCESAHRLARVFGTRAAINDLSTMLQDY